MVRCRPFEINDVVKNSRFMSLREIDERFEKKLASLFQEYYIILNAIPKFGNRIC